MNYNIELIKEKPQLYNNNRLIHYTPIIPSNPIIIDNIWFQKQSNKLKKNLYEIFPNLLLDYVELPNNNIKENDIYWEFIRVYKKQFLFDQYEFIFDDCYIINLTDDEINELLGLYILYTQNYEILNISNNFYEKIQIQLDKCNCDNTGVFVKTSCKSAKHHKKLTPCYNVNDILNNLIISPHVIQSLLSDNCNIILRKWNNNINDSNEFRVFILDKKIKCISQQKLNKIEIIIDYKIIIDSICKMWNDLLTKINYNDCVIDCYIYNNISYIIEINSGGPWSTAGSALFNWEEIMNFECIVLRLLIL